MAQYKTNNIPQTLQPIYWISLGVDAGKILLKWVMSLIALQQSALPVGVELYCKQTWGYTLDNKNNNYIT